MISIVIPNYNGKRFLKGCIESLLAQENVELEIIVVDNGSKDGSVEYLKSNFEDVLIVENETNQGFAGGTNAGIRASSGEYILTMNNDTKADSDFAFQLQKGMQDEDVGMCASKMLFLDDSINSAGICISKSGAAWDRGMFERDFGQYDVSEEVFGPCAGAALYRRKMLDQIGLFDEDFFLYLEDVDLALRARLAGWRCIYMPCARVHHMHGGTAGFHSDLTVYYGNRNIMWYPVKDLPLCALLMNAPWMIFRNLGVIPYYAAHGQGKVILKAKIDGILGIPGMVKKRGKIQRCGPSRDVLKWIRTWAMVGRTRNRTRGSSQKA